ncbi:molybdopterin synthase sulfur carrier subunit [Lentibacillus populi]|uniref:Molybdopterin synthase sulfur carrier subunit n=1 Tax=Lentibacillus populi TaxID=1827502 RepID=A0A9W5TXB6_9BACI|nr:MULTISPECIES: molybdopterin converting factor subunit 1 [Bacillaceae]GGB39831.1 molybdopterin synthase sulfur carrier subunit [Lentibacillus populi]
MIDVLFFAELREAIGKEKISVEADVVSVKELKAKLLATYQLENLDNAMIAVNEEYQTEEAKIADGDVVAFIPPVSGG